MAPTNNDTLRRANIFRFTVPFALFIIVLTWDILLYYKIPTERIHWTVEILFFGILGPSVVYLVLSYVVRKLKLEVDITYKLEKLNKTLESKVKERTEKLAERNAELAIANSELQILDRMKSDFVSLVSHELRGPLTTLNGGIELALQEGENLPPESRRILEIMALESKQLTEFVQTILDVSRLEAGKFNLNLGPVAISPLLERSIQLVNAREKRNIRYTELRGLPPVWADEPALEKIICNILLNAVNYSGAKEPIDLDIALKNGYVVITITDYGAGIPKDAQSRIFERFRRLESGDRVSTKGWGLGLYFAKALTEAQGGSLTLRSPVRDLKETPGSAFTISIPVSDEIPDDA